MASLGKLFSLFLSDFLVYKAKGLSQMNVLSFSPLCCYAVCLRVWGDFLSVMMRVHFPRYILSSPVPVKYACLKGNLINLEV